MTHSGVHCSSWEWHMTIKHPLNTPSSGQLVFSCADACTKLWILCDKRIIKNRTYICIHKHPYFCNHAVQTLQHDYTAGAPTKQWTNSWSFLGTHLLKRYWIVPLNIHDHVESWCLLMWTLCTEWTTSNSMGVVWIELCGNVYTTYSLSFVQMLCIQWITNCFTTSSGADPEVEEGGGHT